MGERANPFGSLDEFGPKKAAAKAVEPAQIERLAQDNGFPSRQRPGPQTAVKTAPQPVPAPARPSRRRVTGRNQQINIKATAETIDRLYRLADERNVPLGELLEQALSALEHGAT